MTRLATARAPLYRWAPPSISTFGDIAANVGTDLGLTPDPEQQWILNTIYAEKAVGIPAAFSVTMIGPRQNFKSATLEIAALTDLFVLGVPLGVWTAHEFKTARKSYLDMRNRILRNPDYKSRCRFRDSHGEEAIILHTGETLEFHARSGGSGRGFTCDRLTLDEALYLRDDDMGALLPTMITRRDAQVRFASSAGFITSDALRVLRDLGRRGGDLASAYVEYGAERRDCAQTECMHLVGTDGCALDDRELWWQANCGLWIGRITEEGIENQRKLMSPAEFTREFYSWWQDPIVGSSIIDMDHWASLGDVTVAQAEPVAFSVEVELGRVSSSIGAAWRRPNGDPHVSHLTQRPGTDWVVDALVKACRRSNLGVTVDGGTEALSLVPAMQAAGLDVHVLKGADRPAVCGLFYDAMKQAVPAIGAGLTHDAQEAVTQALAAAQWKADSQGTRTFARRSAGASISPLYAVSLALHGLVSGAGAQVSVFNFADLEDEQCRDCDCEERIEPLDVCPVCEHVHDDDEDPQDEPYGLVTRTR